MKTQPIHEISRIDSAPSACAFVTLLRNADTKRSQVRAKVAGIVDGNPPYRQSDLTADGQAYRTNVNFREAEQYFNLAVGAFYDLHSESQTLATVTCNCDDERCDEYSRIVTEEFDRLQKKDKSFDSEIQLHQHEMVLYGTGPIFWENQFDWRCRSMKSAALLVPEGTKADVSSWKSCVVLSPYTADDIYRCIEDESAASSVGWNVPAVKNSIMMAGPVMKDGNRVWEWYQSQLRNNTVLYAARSSQIRTAHVFVMEPDGKISHYIVDEDHQNEFLYEKRNKYECWSEFISPMYYDKGNGDHHSVKGMGIKMYAIMELKNRAKCNLVDAAAFRGQTLLQPNSADAMQNASIIPKGPYSIIPPNFTIVNQQATGVLDAPMALDHELDSVLAGNLSQYRQRIEKPNGNPRTAYEIQAIMAQQSTIGKTQISRYYAQLDDVYAQKFSRALACTDSSTEYGKMAMDFKKRCRKRGVPSSALSDCTVLATRVVGQGSSSMRSQSLESLIQLSGSFPPSGQQNLIMDIVASKVGQSTLARYYPQNQTSSSEQDQAAMAKLESAAIKEGVMPLVTGTQNHLVHAQVHISDGAQAVQVLQSNQDAVHDLAAYTIGLVHHLAEHMAALSRDPLHQKEFAALKGQFQQLMKVASDLASHAQGQQQDDSGGGQPDQSGQQADAMKQIAFAKDQQRKDMAVKADIARKQQKASLDMALKDAKTAAAIRRQADAQRAKGS
jgi:hypothetical protein